MLNSETRRAYSTDVTDEQWAIIEPILTNEVKTTRRRRRRKVSLREVVNAIFYIDRSGVQWALLPNDFPPKSTVYDYFARWRDNGKWNEVLTELRTRIREDAGRDATPSAACVDTQSVKTTEMGGDERGYDGNKQLRTPTDEGGRSPIAAA